MACIPILAKTKMYTQNYNTSIMFGINTKFVNAHKIVQGCKKLTYNHHGNGKIETSIIK